MPLHRLLVLSLLLAPVTAVAQASPVRLTARDTLLLTHEFTAQHAEFQRIALRAGQVYRVEVEDGFNVQIRTLSPGEPNPRFATIEPFPRASRTIAFQVMPFVSTVYEIRVDRIRGAAAPLKVFWDASASARRQKGITHA
jgi:hypothetical protein